MLSLQDLNWPRPMSEVFEQLKRLKFTYSLTSISHSRVAGNTVIPYGTLSFRSGAVLVAQTAIRFLTLPYLTSPESRIALAAV